MAAYSSILSKLMSNPLSLFNIPNFQIYQFSFFGVLIFILIALRISLSLIGRKYSTLRVFLGPVFLVLLVAYNYFNSYVASASLDLHNIVNAEVATVPILVFIGILVGHWLARKDIIFLKNGVPHYRSSIVISLVWAVSFMIKMGIITYFPLLHVSFDLVVAVILDVTTGLILGEAFKIHRIHKREYSSSSKASS